MNSSLLPTTHGRGEREGNNIPVKKGTYDVYFNDITGDFNFIEK